MNALKREMERKRKALQEAREKSGGTGGFVKAADLRRVEEEQRDADRYQLQQAKKKKQKDQTTDTRSTEEEQPTRKRHRIESEKKDAPKPTSQHPADHNETSTNDNSKTKVDSHGSLVGLDSAEISRQLRLLGLPVRLFGERKDKERLMRLEKAREGHHQSLLGQSERQEFALEKGHRIHNPFLDQSAGSGSRSHTDDSKAARTKQEDEIQQYTEEDEKKDDHIKVLRYFRGVLLQWEESLEARSESVKQTVAGKNETKTARQCRDYVQPLFRACQKQQLQPNMLAHLSHIVDFARQGEFVKAHDAYMDVAIGRAAWPIGVTMVGIHARTGRSKIESANVAHVMNSELQRKYLTSIKRLLTFAQKQATDVDPSKKVL